MPRTRPASGGAEPGSTSAPCPSLRALAGRASDAGVARTRRTCVVQATGCSQSIRYADSHYDGTDMTGPQTSGRSPERDGRRERWEAHRVARRAELIESVLSAVRARGAGIDMDDVAAVSGVAKPVFYRYFKDKADLFLSVGREVGERLVTEVVAALEGTQHPRAMIAAAVDTFLRAVEDDPEVYRFVPQRPANAET